MNNRIKFILFLTVAYVISWFIGYIAVNQDLNIGLASEYFLQAWTFNGLARPMYVWWLSNGLFVLVATALWLVQKHAQKQNGENM